MSPKYSFTFFHNLLVHLALNMIIIHVNSLIWRLSSTPVFVAIVSVIFTHNCLRHCNALVV